MTGFGRSRFDPTGEGLPASEKWGVMQRTGSRNKSYVPRKRGKEAAQRRFHKQAAKAMGIRLKRYLAILTEEQARQVK